MATKKEVTAVSESSAAMSLNATDYKKITKGAALAFGAAFLYSILMWLSSWMSSGQVDWKAFINPFLTVCIPAAISTGINALIKWWQGQSA